MMIFFFVQSNTSEHVIFDFMFIFNLLNQIGNKTTKNYISIQKFRPADWKRNKRF